LNRLYGAPTVLRPPPAEHTRLLRVLAAVCVGRSGQCTAVWGTPAYGSCGMALSSAHWVLTGYSDGTHTGPLCTAAWSWADGMQCSACVRHHGVYSWVGERHRTAGDLACDARRVLDGYSRAEYRAHRSAPVRTHCGCHSGHIHCTRTARVLSCAQRRPAFRHPFRPTSATPTRRRARRRAGRTLPTRQVRAMRSARPAFPHCPHSPLFSSRHLPAARCIAQRWALPPARDGTARAGSTMALRLAASAVVLPGIPTVLGTL
jgi:hypothetical protein